MQKKSFVKDGSALGYTATLPVSKHIKHKNKQCSSEAVPEAREARSRSVRVLQVQTRGGSFNALLRLARKAVLNLNLTWPERVISALGACCEASAFRTLKRAGDTVGFAADGKEYALGDMRGSLDTLEFPRNTVRIVRGPLSRNP